MRPGSAISFVNLVHPPPARHRLRQVMSPNQRHDGKRWAAFTRRPNPRSLVCHEPHVRDILSANLALLVDAHPQFAFEERSSGAEVAPMRERFGRYSVLEQGCEARVIGQQEVLEDLGTPNWMSVCECFSGDGCFVTIGPLHAQVVRLHAQILARTTDSDDDAITASSPNGASTEATAVLLEEYALGPAPRHHGARRLPTCG